MVRKSTATRRVYGCYLTLKFPTFETVLSRLEVCEWLCKSTGYCWYNIKHYGSVSAEVTQDTVIDGMQLLSPLGYDRIEASLASWSDVSVPKAAKTKTLPDASTG